MQTCGLINRQSVQGMTFIFVLQSVLIVFAIAELVASNYPKIQQQLYVVAFLFTAVWCTAKYAYGPDICIYIPYFRLTTNDLMYNLTHPIHGYLYEKGFVVVCSLCRIAGMTYWEFTAVISVIYFVVLWFLLKNVKRYRTMALLALVFLDSNLFLVELRQCLAVSCFYVAIMAYNNKRYLWAVIFAALMLTMHKTAFVVLIITVLFYMTRGLRLETKSYLLLALLIFGLMFLPISEMLSSVVSELPLPASYIASAKHHLLVGKNFQKVIILYISTILVLAWYTQTPTDSKARHWLMWCCVAVLAFLFPYWFLLNRFRSFFIPFLIMYVIETINNESADVLPRQIYTSVVMAYICLMTVLIPHNNKSLKYPTDRVSVVFERINHSEVDLTERQLKQAIKYWEYDYGKLIENGQNGQKE